MDCRTPTLLPNGYLQHWLDLARWSIAQSHGPAARYAVMFALPLRRSALACSKHVNHVSHRVWEVKTRAGRELHISLFDGKMINALLATSSKL